MGTLSSLLNPGETYRKKEDFPVLAPVTFGIINCPRYGDYRSKARLQLAEKDRGGERRLSEEMRRREEDKVK